MGATAPSPPSARPCPTDTPPPVTTLLTPSVPSTSPRGPLRLRLKQRLTLTTDTDTPVLDMLAVDTPDLDTQDVDTPASDMLAVDTLDSDTPGLDTMASVRPRPSLRLRLKPKRTLTTDTD